LPTRTPPGCGPARSRKRAAGPRRYADSSRGPEPDDEVATHRGRGRRKILTSCRVGLSPLSEKAKVLKPLIAEMKAAGVLIFTGGLDDAAPVFMVPFQPLESS